MSRDQKKAESRRRILDAARLVFFRDGFMRANLDEVAEQAGVAKGTLYRYFDSKADLYVAILAENGKLFEEHMRAADVGDDALARVRSIARFYFEHWRAHPEYFRIFWAIDNQSVIGELPEGVIQEVMRLWEESLGILHGVLEEGVARGEIIACDTWAVAHVLWSLANSLIESDDSPARRQLRRRPLSPIYAHAIDTVMRGILVDPDRVDLRSTGRREAGGEASQEAAVPDSRGSSA